MGFIKKMWNDRISEYSNRRTMLRENGESEIVYLSRNEGAISQEGDAFSANNMNDLEDRVNNAFEEEQMQDGLTLLASGWSASAPFSQTVTLERIKASDTPIISMGVANPATPAEYKAMGKAYGFIDRAITSEGAITFYCYNKKPAVNINVLVKGV